MELLARIFTALGHFFYRLAKLAHRAIFGLTPTEQRALMTWGMLGGIVALTLVLMWLVHLADARLPRATLGAEALAIIDGLFLLCYMLIGLIGLFAAGIVAIARNGDIEAKVTRDGVDIHLTAAGGAASNLATNASVSTLTNPGTPPPPQPPAKPVG